MTFSCREKVGVDWEFSRGWHKKSQGGSCVWKNACLILFQDSEGSRTRAQRLGEMN